MTRSYEQVDYAVRPAKHIERLMMVEAFHRLGVFQPISDYVYVGFGAIYYRDFLLVHKRLGIHKMRNLELDGDRGRVDFNSPFTRRVLRTYFRGRDDPLPALSWSKERLIVWLDYDAHLRDAMLSDVTTLCFEAPSGTFLAITVDVEPRIGRDPIAPTNLVLDRKWLVGATTAGLQGEGLARLSYDTLAAHVSSVIEDRNGTLPPRSAKLVRFEQVLHFRYADGRQMLTFGGVICSQEERAKYLAADFRALGFFAGGARPYRIRAPFLTYRERRHLDTRLPVAEPENFGRYCERRYSIPRGDAASYAKLYRYFPTYADADL